jgi:hypothetical protein
VAVARAVVEAVGRGKRAVFNNQLKVAAEVMMAATTVTGSGYGCNNGDDGGSDDSGCGGGDGDTSRGSGGDSDTVGSSGGDGNSEGGSFGDSESDGGDGNSDSVSRRGGDSDGSSESSNNGITVSLVPFLVECCISPITITVATDRHRDRDRPCHRPHPCPCPRPCHCPLPLPPVSPKSQLPLPPLITKAAAMAAIATAAIIAATTPLPRHCQCPRHHQRHNGITVSVVPFLADCDTYDLAPGFIVIVLLLLFWTLQVQAADIIIINRRVPQQVV